MVEMEDTEWEGTEWEEEKAARDGSRNGTCEKKAPWRE